MVYSNTVLSLWREMCNVNLSLVLCQFFEALKFRASFLHIIKNTDGICVWTCNSDILMWEYC